LNNEEQTTLRLAALLGREFEYEMLLAIAGQDEDGLIDVLEKADQAQLIEEIFRPTAGASTKFSFTHALIHTTLLSTLSTLRRQRLQRQVAMSLEQAFPERHDELASLLGRYFAEADDGEKAVYYLLRAGDAARRIYAYDEAIQAYEQALLFLREQSDHQRAARTFMKLGLAYHNTYSHQKSRRAYEEGLREWRKSTDTQKDHSFPPAPHPLRAVAQEGPSGLDVSIVYDNWSHFFIHQLFSGLFEFTDDDQLVPDIAQSWDVLEKDKRYVFHLRKNATWSDGEPVTARDFEFSWKRSLQPGRVQGMAYLLYDIKGAQAYHQGTESDPDSVGVRAEDDYTLRIDLERSSSYFLQILAHAIAFPIPRHMVERLGPSWTEPKHIVTNGPFKIGEWSPKKKFILEKDLNYRGYFKGNVSQLEVQIQPPETWLELYMENAIDYMFPYLTSAHDPNRSILSNHEDYISLPSSHTGYLGFDVSRPPFDDIRVRQAVIMAIDRQTVIYNRARGLFLPANGGLVAPGIPGHVPDIALPYDPELAAEKLAAAGYPDGKTFPNVEIMMPLNMEFGGIFNRFAEQWKANLGLDVTYRAYEFNELLERHASDNPKVWIGGWSADYPDPDSYLRVLLRNSSTGWFHQGYEKLIYDAREITDVDQRMAMYQQAERILTQEAVLVPLSHGRLHLMVKPWISSLPFSMFIGIIPKEVVIEPHE
jgi:oligopeptide transport system substrate-binding protein